jgi:TetR/AcrR family transcriptional regulator, tetracycline repressor protein
LSLDRRQIVGVALDLLDEVGFEGLSTRALAERLGVKGPSLYWHFRSMRELLDHMAEAMLGAEMPSPDPAQFAGDWTTWLAEGARAIRRAANARRDGARVLAGATPTGQGGPDFNAMVRRLEREGFAAADARAALMALGRYALGWVLDEQVAHGPTAASDSDFEFGLLAMIRGIGAVRGRRPRVDAVEGRTT